MHTPKKELAAAVVAEPRRGAGEVWRWGVPLEWSKKKLKMLPQNAHFSIFVPQMGVQILLEASVCACVGR